MIQKLPPEATIHIEAPAVQISAIAPAAEVLGLVDWRFKSPFLDFDAPLFERIEALGRLVGEQVARLKAIDPEAPTDHILCSSYFPKILTDIPERTNRLMEMIALVGGVRPAGLIQTYECASWGCVWRCHAGFSRNDDFMFTVVDADLHGLTHFAGHPSVGASGFGMTTVHLRLPADNRGETVFVDGPYPDSGFKEFIRALRGRHARVGSKRVMIPFFREDLGLIAQRIVGPETACPNRNAVHGHCFGSDPWIALAEAVIDGTLAEGDLATLGTLAYNGYFAVADVRAPAPARVEHSVWP
ncbi:MAG TPA: hypothetical protein VF680_09240 [Allosphingosinicella sp.]